MRFLWLDINSSYSHSSLAIPSLDAQLDLQLKAESEWEIVSGTISSDPTRIISAIYSKKPDTLLSTVWLFNHKYLLDLIIKVKALLPNLKVILGGPEFLGDNHEFLIYNKEVNAVLRGEGEGVFSELVSKLIDNKSIANINGICTIVNNTYIDNGEAVSPPISTLSIPEDSPFFQYDKPFVQIETSRGCFNSCKFCVSGCATQKVSYINYTTLNDRFQNICNRGVKEVRILDRTFNSNSIHAGELLKLMIKFSGKLRFHLEIHPAFISDSLKKVLEMVPKGLIHAEAGIQSLDADVIKNSGRKGDPDKSLLGLYYLRSLNNIEIHADLIVGLPGYTIARLKADFIELVKCGVDEIQIELLKLLPGTHFRLNSRRYSLIYSPIPPYEVLQTGVLSYQELAETTILSKISDLWYNYKGWRDITRVLIINNNDFINLFLEYLANYELFNISAEKRGQILYDFCAIHYPQYLSYISNAWILNGFSLKKGPGTVARGWKDGLTGKKLPFSNTVSGRDKVYYIESPDSYHWYLFGSESKRVKEYVRIDKSTNL